MFNFRKGLLSVACAPYSSHFSQRNLEIMSSNVITDLVVFFADMGYKVSLRLHDYVDCQVKDIFKSNLAAYSENIENGSIWILRTLNIVF